MVSSKKILTVIENIKLRNSPDGHGSVKYLCKCGKTGVMSNSRFAVVKSCGCERKKNTNLVGRPPFGKLTVISHFNDLKNERWATCRCECGNTKDVRVKFLLSGNTISCGCYKPHQLPYGVSVMRAIIGRYKRGASLRGLEFTLTTQEMEQLFSQNCHYCGSEPSLIGKHRHCVGQFIYNGIDRIDSTLGYNTSNCVACCKTCNYMKLNMDKLDFLEHVGKIFNHLNRTLDSGKEQ